MLCREFPLEKWLNIWDCIFSYLLYNDESIKINKLDMKNLEKYSEDALIILDIIWASMLIFVKN